MILPVLLATALPLAGDIIRQTNAEGRQIIIQQDAIVVSADSSSVVYKHFDLKEMRVVKVVLNQGSLPYSVERTSPAARHEIVDLWKRFGFTAVVIDTAGKSTRVYDAYLDFYPPGGRGSLLEAVPARTNLPVELASGGAELAEFADISRVEFQDDRLRVTLTNGQVKEGHFLMPAPQPIEARFLGITDRYDPSSSDVFDFSLPLARVKQIDFEH